jgi:hypothetical protein
MPSFFIHTRRNLSAYALNHLFLTLVISAVASIAAAQTGPGPAPAAPPQTTQAQSQQAWASYKNPRFGYTLSYPSGVFTPQPPAANGDGQSFLSTDGRAKLVVYGAQNSENFTPSKYRETILREFGGYDQMDYSPTGKTWFVLSGFRGENIYYQKVMFSCGGGVINVLSVTFPRAEKKFYEGLVETMEDNFKPAPAGQGCG